jgi:hypothetical protein
MRVRAGGATRCALFTHHTSRDDVENAVEGLLESILHDETFDESETVANRGALRRLCPQLEAERACNFEHRAEAGI